MNIFVSSHAGFCFGVKKAINSAFNEAKKTNDKIYTYGPLIHNKQVVDKFETMGIIPIKDLVDAKDSNLIIRSHGVPLTVYEEAKKYNIELIDATCPFVRKVQNIAREHYLKGYHIIVVGNPEHPEVIGINGWCENNASIVRNENEVVDLVNLEKCCIVAQTTITMELWNNVLENIQDKTKKLVTFNTICLDTQDRQSSCEELAKKVDVMIVIGGYHSSNTQKLFQISNEYCKNSFHIETVEELPIDIIRNYNNIGVTAGASTPDWIIKEVIERMNSIDQQNNPMENMMDEIENSLRVPRRGSIVTGKVIHVTENEIMVNIGYKADGIIPKNEISNDPSMNPRDLVKEGDELFVYIIKTDDGDGNLLLSKKKVDSEKAWDNVENVQEENKVIEVKIVEVVNGGVIAAYKEIKGFIPASHISDSYVSNLQELIGNVLDVKIIDFNKQKKKVVFSHKAVANEKKEAKRSILWSTIEKDMIIEGEVKRLANFGAFVDVGGVDGLIHISDLSWGRVSNPGLILNVGDRVKVKVLDFDKEKNRISLGLKQTMKEPWTEISTKYGVGNIVEGKVVRLVQFGVFVELEPGVDGLVHISQISDKHISKPSEVLQIGQVVKVKVLEVNTEAKRISLSIKDANEKSDTEENNYISEDSHNITIGEVIQFKEGN